MIHLVIWSTLSLSVPRALSNGRRSPVLSTAAARATQPPSREPLTTQGRREVRTAINTGGTSVKDSAQQGFDAGLMRGFVHRTGVYSENKLWGPHGRYQSQDPEPNLKLAAVPPTGGSYQSQRSSWASQVAGGTSEVMLAAQERAATDQKREGQTAVEKAAHYHVSSAPRSIRLRHRLLRWWRWQRVCSTYTYRQGWEDGAWLFEHGGRTIAAAAAAAATRATNAATNAATRAAAAARAALCGFGRQRSAPALSDGALPEEFPVLYAFFPERGMVKLTEQELKERCEAATYPAIE